ncbi:MAG: alpha/beta hydrolase [Hyphomicrobiales bacterium]|nr:alpha/beta hydrolase [Hyphomicrobiales bacterium]
MSTVSMAIRPPSPLLMMLEARAFHELGAFVGALPLLRLAPRGDGHPVLVLPGLLASDRSTTPLRRFLANRGYAVSGWEMGNNFGLREGVEEGLAALVKGTTDRHGRKVSIVGWSLGGLYARQLAKLFPDEVRSVISLGSPFNGSPRATNAWRVYEFVSGHKAEADERQMHGHLEEAPSVPTTAIFSRTDGVCAWQVCMEKETPHTENIEVQGSHCGLAHHPAAVFAIADRLSQPEGQWTKFERTGWRAMLFPDPARPG